MELRYLEALGFGKYPVELLLTSSGMAAYQVIESFPLRAISLDDSILLPPYIYFEASEQLEALKFLNISRAP